MKNTKFGTITIIAMVAMIITLAVAAQAQTRAYRVSDRQVQNQLDRIDASTTALKEEIDNLPDNRRTNSAGTLVANFENATDNLKSNFSAERSTTNDVQAVLDQAYPLNTFVRNNQLSANTQTQWQQLRNNLDILASYYSVRTGWNDQVTTPVIQGGYTVTDTQMRTLLSRLGTRERSFRTAFNSWTRYGGRNNAASNTEVSQWITEFETALTDLRSNFSDRNGGNRGIEPVLRPSVEINSYLGSNRTNTSVTSRWTLVRNDLNTLASYYRLSWDWNNPVYPTNDRFPTDGRGGNSDARWTGTFRLNTAQSDNVASIVDRAIANGNYTADQRERTRRMLERRLQSPETLSFERRGSQITMSSTNAAAATLQADGVTQTETNQNGRTVNVTVTATDREITITYEGDRMNDYYVSFAAARDGQLRVTRRVNLEDQGQTVTATSVYDRTSRTPQWNTTVTPVNTGNGTQDRFVIPNNTTLTATLDRTLSTRTAQDGDRFSMTVTSPSQYYGAVIEGSVNGQRSGVQSGRGMIAMTFETIRLRNGRTYRFAGIVDSIRDTNGNTVNVNNDGVTRDNSQTNRPAGNAGIGGIIGAILGAIVDSGQGAGAGTGTGSVVLQGRDNFDLGAGTQFTITSMAPSNVNGP